MWFCWLKLDEGASAKSSRWRKTFSLDFSGNEAIAHSHTHTSSDLGKYERESNKVQRKNISNLHAYVCVVHTHSLRAGPFRPIFIKWCYTRWTCRDLHNKESQATKSPKKLFTTVFRLKLFAIFTGIRNSIMYVECVYVSGSSALFLYIHACMCASRMFFAVNKLEVFTLSFWSWHSTIVSQKCVRLPLEWGEVKVFWAHSQTHTHSTHYTHIRL